MRLLFAIDKQDYPSEGEVFRRPSARAIIVKDGRIAMLYSRKHHYYKLPGGGIEPEESIIEAMMREVLEETGLAVISETVREYGYVHRIQKGKYEPIFIQDNYYFFCDVEDTVQEPTLTAEEIEEAFVLAYPTPQEAIHANQKATSGELNTMLLRENRVLEMLLEEHRIQTDRKE